ncbi:hypothetical protein Ae201684_007174 [Aphanomyces euteiches]|uniref:Telomeric single stranded DNA binding POT1/Cdc13 domain-containing protein n=1 Tax=Aphanomyces euteiches TaxID=100861 RepID=A0A6G0X9F8_9STRA|nr:hypothetical protein Ae201684_007174 [Aphanomyces euteiches]
MDHAAWLQRTRVTAVWPMRTLPLAAASEFDIDTGPCASAASRVVSMEVVEIMTSVSHESSETPQRIYVHFYDKWADHVQHFVQHFKVGFFGRGVKHWEDATESYDVNNENACIVIAEHQILVDAGLLHPSSPIEDITIKFNVARREALVSPITYGEEVTISSATLNDEVPQEVRSINRGSRGVAENRIYFYTTLSALTNNANTYGIVTSFSKPKRSTNGRNDFEMTVSLIDESRPERSQAFYVNVFDAAIENLPQLLYIGDILRFHTLALNAYEGYSVGISSSHVTRFLVVRENQANPQGPLDLIHPYKTCTFTPTDEERCRSLIAWSKKVLAQDQTFLPRNTQGFILLDNCFNLESRTIVDVLVKVVGMSKDFLSDSGVFRVSNGYNDESSVSLRVHREWTSLTRRGLIPTVEKRWCKFRSIEIKIDHGAIQLLYNKISSLEILPDYLYEVREAIKRASMNVTNPAPTTTLWTNNISLAKMTIAEFINSPAPHRALCFANVADIWPSNIASITTMIDSHFNYMCVFRLEDYTASIDAILYGKEAVLVSSVNWLTHM